MKAAAAALGGAANYTWHQAVEVPDGGSSASTTDGKTEKDGYTTLSFSFGDNTTEAVLKGTNAAVKTPDNGWQSPAEAIGGQRWWRWIQPGHVHRAHGCKTYKTPDVQAASLADVRPRI